MNTKFTRSAGPNIRSEPVQQSIRRGIALLLICLGVYIVSYIILSSKGSYIGHNLGGSDNRDTWFPAYCAERYISRAGRHKVRLTPLGWLFFPAMLVDQIAIHRTHFDVE